MEAGKGETVPCLGHASSLVTCFSGAPQLPRNVAFARAGGARACSTWGGMPAAFSVQLDRCAKSPSLFFPRASVLHSP